MERIETLNKQIKEEKILFKRCKYPTTVSVKINNPKRLNALDISMYQKLSQIAQDQNNKIIILRGTGDKAFTCGGDVKQLYKCIASNDEEQQLNYFVSEVEMDYSFHLHNQISKCTQISIYNSVAIGGGLTMSIYSKIKICTEKTLISLPEGKNGLTVPFINYFINLRDNLGAYLILTGVFIKGEDCVRFGLADYFVEQKYLDDLQDELEQQENVNDCHLVCQKYAKKVDIDQIKNFQYIKELFDLSTDFNAFWKNLNEKAEQNNDMKLKQFAQYCLKEINMSSKLSILLNYHIMKNLQNSNAPTEQKLLSQLKSSVNVTKYSQDCIEGLKRAVVDKTYIPQWKHDSVYSVTQPEIDVIIKSEDKLKQLLKKVNQDMYKCQQIFQNKEQQITK